MLKIRQKGFLKIKYDIITNKHIFRFLPLNLKITIFCQFSNPWVPRVPGIGCYGKKCKKMPKSLQPTAGSVKIFLQQQRELAVVCKAIPRQRGEIFYLFYSAVRILESRPVMREACQRPKQCRQGGQGPPE